MHVHGLKNNWDWIEYSYKEEEEPLIFQLPVLLSRHNPSWLEFLSNHFFFLWELCFIRWTFWGLQAQETVSQIALRDSSLKLLFKCTHTQTHRACLCWPFIRQWDYSIITDLLLLALTNVSWRSFQSPWISIILHGLPLYGCAMFMCFTMTNNAAVNVCICVFGHLCISIR